MKAAPCSNCFSSGQNSFREIINRMSLVTPIICWIHLNMIRNAMISSQSMGAGISEIHFTKRELELLVLIMEGSSNEEIAQMLMISIGTVKRYIHNIYQKLEVKNRVQAVKKIKENHLIRRCLL
ncbi:response regulator transcription factor [Paenibacillus glucanolyticus]|nr:response regulator transcription factor [Paenibacillus glucanolyticus]